MAYVDEGMSTGRMVGLGAVIALHALLGWAFMTGLGSTVVKVIKNPMEVFEVDEPEPVVEEEPPPPPPELEEVQPYVPEVDLPIEIPPPPAPPPITTQREVRQTQPVTVAKPAPAPKPSVTTQPVPSRRNARVLDLGDITDRAKNLGLGGTFEVQYTVTTNGRAVNCRATKSSGSDWIDEQTCRRIERGYRFDPATKDGEPFAMSIRQPVRLDIPQ